MNWAKQASAVIGLAAVMGSQGALLLWGSPARAGLSAVPFAVAQGESETVPQSESETPEPREDEPQAGPGDEPGVIRPPRQDEPGEFGGCIFRDKPLELMV